MKYNCILCGYKTDRKYNYTTHLKSNTHRLKLQEETKEKINKERMELIDKIDKLEKQVKKYKKYKKKYEEEIKNKVKYLEKNKQSMEKILERSLENNKLSLENNNIVAKTSKKSISAINYLIKNCADCSSIESYDLDSIQDSELLKIAFNPKHMGNVITNVCVISNGIDKSGIRCMDFNRLKFGVNVGGSWVTDTTGNIIRDKFIKPITKKAYRCLNKWMSDLTIQGNVPTEDIKKYQKGIENIRSLDDDKIQNKVLKRLGSNCMIDRGKLDII
jgi:protoporphyrinogen oxidase